MAIEEKMCAKNGSVMMRLVIVAAMACGLLFVFFLVNPCELGGSYPQISPPRGIWRAPVRVQSPTLFQLPATNMYFAEFHGTDSMFLELRTNGTYDSIMRMHVGIYDWDEGTWKQAEDGNVVLVSSKRYHDITTA